MASTLSAKTLRNLAQKLGLERTASEEQVKEILNTMLETNPQKFWDLYAKTSPSKMPRTLGFLSAAATMHFNDLDTPQKKTFALTCHSFQGFQLFVNRNIVDLADLGKALLPDNDAELTPDTEDLFKVFLTCYETLSTSKDKGSKRALASLKREAGGRTKNLTSLSTELLLTAKLAAEGNKAALKLLNLAQKKDLASFDLKKQFEKLVAVAEQQGEAVAEQQGEATAEQQGEAARAKATLLLALHHTQNPCDTLSFLTNKLHNPTAQQFLNENQRYIIAQLTRLRKDPQKLTPFTLNELLIAHENLKTHNSPELAPLLASLEKTIQAVAIPAMKSSMKKNKEAASTGIRQEIDFKLNSKLFNSLATLVGKNFPTLQQKSMGHFTVSSLQMGNAVSLEEGTKATGTPLTFAELLANRALAFSIAVLNSSESETPTRRVNFGETATADIVTPNFETLQNMWKVAMANPTTQCYLTVNRDIRKFTMPEAVVHSAANDYPFEFFRLYAQNPNHKAFTKEVVDHALTNLFKLDQESQLTSTAQSVEKLEKLLKTLSAEEQASVKKRLKAELSARPKLLQEPATILSEKCRKSNDPLTDDNRKFVVRTVTALKAVSDFATKTLEIEKGFTPATLPATVMSYVSEAIESAKKAEEKALNEKSQAFERQTTEAQKLFATTLATLTKLEKTRAETKGKVESEVTELDKPTHELHALAEKAKQEWENKQAELEALKEQGPKANWYQRTLRDNKKSIRENSRLVTHATLHCKSNKIVVDEVTVKDADYTNYEQFNVAIEAFKTACRSYGEAVTYSASPKGQADEKAQAKVQQAAIDLLKAEKTLEALEVILTERSEAAQEKLQEHEASVETKEKEVQAAQKAYEEAHARDGLGKQITQTEAEIEAKVRAFFKALSDGYKDIGQQVPADFASTQEAIIAAIKDGNEVEVFQTLGAQQLQAMLDARAAKQPERTAEVAALQEALPTMFASLGGLVAKTHRRLSTTPALKLFELVADPLGEKMNELLAANTDVRHDLISPKIEVLKRCTSSDEALNFWNEVSSIFTTSSPENKKLQETLSRIIDEKISHYDLGFLEATQPIFNNLPAKVKAFVKARLEKTIDHKVNDLLRDNSTENHKKITNVEELIRVIDSFNGIVSLSPENRQKLIDCTSGMGGTFPFGTDKPVEERQVQVRSGVLRRNRTLTKNVRLRPQQAFQKAGDYQQHLVDTLKQALTDKATTEAKNTQRKENEAQAKQDAIAELEEQFLGSRGGAFVDHYMAIRKEKAIIAAKSAKAGPNATKEQIDETVIEEDDWKPALEAEAEAALNKAAQAYAQALAAANDDAYKALYESKLTELNEAEATKPENAKASDEEVAAAEETALQTAKKITRSLANPIVKAQLPPIEQDLNPEVAEQAREAAAGGVHLLQQGGGVGNSGSHRNSTAIERNKGTAKI